MFKIQTLTVQQLSVVKTFSKTTEDLGAGWRGKCIVQQGNAKGHLMVTQKMMLSASRPLGHPFRAIGWYFHLKVFSVAKNTHLILRKVEQRSLFLFGCFMAPRASKSVRGPACSSAMICGCSDDMRSRRSGMRAPFSLNPQLQSSKIDLRGCWLQTPLSLTVV